MEKNIKYTGNDYAENSVSSEFVKKQIHKKVLLL